MYAEKVAALYDSDPTEIPCGGHQPQQHYQKFASMQCLVLMVSHLC